MEINYKLYRIREMADGDEDFVKELISAFLLEIPVDIAHLREAVLDMDFPQVKYYAHKIKPTIDLFETGLLDDVRSLESWGEAEINPRDIQTVFLKVENQLKEAIEEMKLDFNLS